MVLMMYFAYTTLSTVGFGDLNPRSDFERLVTIVIFIVGVSSILSLSVEIIMRNNQKSYF